MYRKTINRTTISLTVSLIYKILGLCNLLCPQLRPACRQRVDLPKQKHSVHPFAFPSASPNVPSLHSSHRRPIAFSWNYTES